MKKLDLLGFTSLGMVIASMIIWIFGIVYEIPNEHPIVPVFQVLVSCGISLGFVWGFVFILLHYKEY